VKNVLFGAVGRHNFGDLLMPHVIESLLPEVDFTVAGLVESDMTGFGGHKVVAIDSLFDSDEKVNVVHVGGEVGACGVDCAKSMIPDGTSIVGDRQLAYLLEKSSFKNAGCFVANSIGGMSADAVEVLGGYDHVSSRDGRLSNNVAPDCAVMVRELFDDKIQDSNQAGLEMRDAMGDYIAVQVNKETCESFDGEVLDVVLREMERLELPVVLFCAGVAPNHDSLEAYADSFGPSLPNLSAWYFDDYNIWSTCNVIANAASVITTSLHVNIVAGAYGVPCKTINESHKVYAHKSIWGGKKRHSSICDLYRSNLENWAGLIR